MDKNYIDFVQKGEKDENEGMSVYVTVTPTQFNIIIYALCKLRNSEDDKKRIDGLMLSLCKDYANSKVDFLSKQAGEKIWQDVENDTTSTGKK